MSLLQRKFSRKNHRILVSYDGESDLRRAMGPVSLGIIRVGELNRGPEKVEEALRQADIWIGERSIAPISIDERLG